jgi:DNA polymerase-3 subunit epsilon
MYAVVDIETTGGSKKTGKIIEIAIFIFDGENVVDSFSSFINPECHLSTFTTQLTGITNEMVINAPKFYEVARKIVEITENKIFVAHNVAFDYNFIREEFKNLGYDYHRKKLCTVQLARKYIPGHQSYSLGKICDNLGIEIKSRHRAAGDALATVKLLHMILDDVKKTNNTLF